MARRKDPPSPKTTRKTFKLASRAASGDIDAGRLLDDHLRPWLLQKLKRRKPPGGVDLDSVVQDAFIDLFRCLGDVVDGARGAADVSVRAVLWTIAKGDLVDAVRRLEAKKRREEIRFGDGETAPAADDFADRKAHRPSAEARGNELLARASACLQQLSSKRQQLVRLYLLEGHPKAEVMSVLGLSDAAFRTALSHARDQLEACLGLTPRLKPS